ncbi:MAG: lipopolysaccharide transport periplasmic protein LptA [Nitrospiraceae bacterium]|nr:lipopolysaccharide transport periplasmic protein LptA [Nitrospiraceae bacterium]
MSKRFFIKTLPLLLGIFIAASGFSPSFAIGKNGPADKAVSGGKAGAPGDKNKTGKGPAAKKGPIVITSDRLSADSNTHTAVFSGRVQAKNDNMWLYSDKMVVHYSEEGGVQTIDAVGRVKLIKEDRVVTSDKALYTKADDKVVFTGKPKIVQGDTIVTGAVITYYVSADRMDVQNSKVLMQSK